MVRSTLILLQLSQKTNTPKVERHGSTRPSPRTEKPAAPVAPPVKALTQVEQDKLRRAQELLEKKDDEITALQREIVNQKRIQDKIRKKYQAKPESAAVIASLQSQLSTGNQKQVHLFIDISCD